MNSVSPETRQLEISEPGLYRLLVSILPIILAGLYFWMLWASSTLNRPPMGVSDANWKMFPFLAYIAGGLLVALSYNASFRASTRGSYYHTADSFHIKPAPLPKPMMLLGFGGIFFPIIAVSQAHHYLGNRHNELPVFMFAGVISCIAYYAAEWLLSRSANRDRSESKITLNNGLITFGKNSVSSKNITRLVMRNHVLEIEPANEQAFVISSGNTYTDAMGSGALALGSSGRALLNGWRSLAGQFCFRIDLESGGKAIVVAGGLDEVTAYGLMSDLARELNLEIAR